MGAGTPWNKLILQVPLIIVIPRVRSLKIDCFCSWLVFISFAVINHDNSFLITLAHLKTYDPLNSSGNIIGWVEIEAHGPLFSNMRSLVTLMWVWSEDLM